MTEWYRRLSANKDIDALAKECAGNWKSFESFHWYDKPENADAFMLFYTVSRDSGLLAESNSAAITKIFDNADLSYDVRSESHSHWACVWVGGYAVRCIDTEGKATPAFKALVEIAQSLDAYPVLDESDYSEREYEATLANIKSEGQSLVKDISPENWASQVFSWLWENNQSAVENTDDQGGYPSKDDIREALEDLGMLEDNEDE
jgi:hypothetical protein